MNWDKINKENKTIKNKVSDLHPRSDTKDILPTTYASRSSDVMNKARIKGIITRSSRNWKGLHPLKTENAKEEATATAESKVELLNIISDIVKK